MNLTLQDIYENLGLITNIAFVTFFISILMAIIAGITPENKIQEFFFENIGLYLCFFLFMVCMGGLGAHDQSGGVRMVANICFVPIAVILFSVGIFRSLGLFTRRGPEALPLLLVIGVVMVTCVRVKLAMVYHV